MKKLIAVLILGMAFFQSCNDCTITELEDPQNFDCPDIMLNIGDTCDDSDSSTENDVIGEDCICLGVSIFDCPDLSLNIGDPCDDGNPDTDNDVVNGNCECVGGDQEVDCPDLMLNIGDDCTDGDETTINDVVTADCVCVGESIFDCPDLGLNIGDPCDDGNPDTQNDIVNEMCICIGEIVFDCPDLGLNIGDPCDDENPDTNNDLVDEMCICIGEPIFDCPNLGLNLGDPCDDGNPATENDVATLDDEGNCICLGTPIIQGCEGTLYASRLLIDNTGVANWHFDQALITSGQIGNFTNIEQKNNSLLNDLPFGTNAAAFNPINGKYVMAYQYSIGLQNPLYCANTDVFSSTFLDEEVFYGAPVFFNGRLYAINIFYNAPNVQYSIVEIDQSTGIPSILFTDNIVVNSPMSDISTSSTSDQENTIYFVSHTNLIAFNPSTNIGTHIDIDASYSASNPIAYVGLEYNLNKSQILAMRLKSEGVNDIADLVSITTDGSYEVSSGFDILANLGSNNDGEIDFNQHSTSFSQCDNIYYISELVKPEVNPLQSSLIAIDLDDNTFDEVMLEGLIYGLEIKDE